MEGYIGEIFDAGVLGSSFKGIVRVTGPVAVTGLRFRHNERREQVYTTLAAVQYRSANLRDVYFPHIVDGEGYRTQFILIETDSYYSGELRFRSQAGAPMSLSVTPLR